MIVRISTEGQYYLSGDLPDRLNEMDNRIVEAVGRGDEALFSTLFGEMLAVIRREGKLLEQDEIAESEMILPPPDLTFSEARELFTGEGIIPDGKAGS